MSNVLEVQRLMMDAAFGDPAGAPPTPLATNGGAGRAPSPAPWSTPGPLGGREWELREAVQSGALALARSAGRGVGTNMHEDAEHDYRDAVVLSESLGAGTARMKRRLRREFQEAQRERRRRRARR